MPKAGVRPSLGEGLEQGIGSLPSLHLASVPVPSLFPEASADDHPTSLTNPWDFVRSLPKGKRRALPSTHQVWSNWRKPSAVKGLM